MPIPIAAPAFAAPSYRNRLTGPAGAIAIGASMPSLRQVPSTPSPCGRPQAVRVVGVPTPGQFSKTAFIERQFCTKCGGHLMTNHTIGLVRRCRGPCPF